MQAKYRLKTRFGTGVCRKQETESRKEILDLFHLGPDLVASNFITYKGLSLMPNVRLIGFRIHPCLSNLAALSYRFRHNRSRSVETAPFALEIGNEYTCNRPCAVPACFHIFCPEDPRVPPWPDGCLHIIAEDCHTEGLVVADLDGDGENEGVAGPGFFKRDASGRWVRTALAPDLDVRTPAAVADLDGGGLPDTAGSPFDSGRDQVDLWINRSAG